MTAYTVAYAYTSDGTFLAAQGSSHTDGHTGPPDHLTVGNPAKTYGGTTAATLTSANFSLTGLVGADTFTVTQTAGPTTAWM